MQKDKSGRRRKSIFVLIAKKQEERESIRKIEGYLEELGVDSDQIMRIGPHMPKLKHLNEKLIIKALKNHQKDNEMLIWVYAKGVSVKVDNMLELMVANPNNKKSFPLEKALRGLQSIPKTFVSGLFDCQLSGSNDSTTAKNAVLLSNNGGHKNSCMMISACQGNHTLVDSYFERLKQ